MMLSVEAAIEIASSHASNDITHGGLRPVVVEPTRVWATDGHRALVLSVEASSNQVGHYLDGVKLVHLANVPKIDAVLPTVNPSINLQLTPQQLADLRAFARMLDRRTYARIQFGTCASDKAFLERSKGKLKERCSVTLPEMPLARLHDFSIDLGYLLDAVDGVYIAEQDDVTLRQADEGAPIVIRGERGFSLVMPCRL